MRHLTNTERRYLDELSSGSGTILHSHVVVNTTRLTAAGTITVTDEVLFCDTDGGSWTAALPAGVEGTHYKLINCGANTLTVDPNGIEELFGAGAGVASTLEEGEVIDIHYSATEGWY
jgi:hypothetical protein